MFEIQEKSEIKDINDRNNLTRKSFKMNNNRTTYEDKIRNSLIQNTESYEGIGEKMINIVKDICGILLDYGKEDPDSIYTCIIELMVEFIATQPYKTGIFAGVTALMSTSLMNELPLSKKSNLPNQIINCTLERFVLELKESNYSNCQLLLNFITEVCNFYLIDLNILISIYRILLDKCFMLKETKDDKILKYDINDHNSFILFSMIAYTLPLLRDELRKSEDKDEENIAYNEIIKDMNLFYNTYLVDYCNNVNILLQSLISKKLLCNKLFEIPFERYWKKFLEWKDNQCPRIMTILRFYRSTTILDYLSEILSPKEIKYDEILNNLIFGKINEYFLKLLIRFPLLESMDIGEYILVNIMDEIIDIFMQSPYETARQLLKIPIKTSSYDLCLSISIWNSLLNPFYSYNICYINNLVINLINLQNSFFIDIWTPIFVNNINNFDNNKEDLNNQNITDLNDEDNNMINMKDSDNRTGILTIHETYKNSDSTNNKFVDYRIFPNLMNFSIYMIIRLKKHFSTIFSCNYVFFNSSFKDSFWNNKEILLFHNENNNNEFISGFLHSILDGMTRLMLPQTLSSIPNSILKNKIDLFNNNKLRTIPESLLNINELNELKKKLIFKMNEDEIIDRNNEIIQYLISILDKESGNNIDDTEMEKRFEERDTRNENSEFEKKDSYKVLKKRKIEENLDNINDRFIWSKDSLMDIMIISIIEQGGKSMTHTKRLFNNYKKVIFDWYKNNSDEFPNNESDSKLSPNTTNHIFFDHITNISLEIMKEEIFKNCIKFIFEFEDLNEETRLENTPNSFLLEYREIRILSIIFTIWGGLIHNKSGINLEYNFQKVKNIIVIAIEEDILTPNIVVIYLTYILSCIKASSFFDISSNSKKYQIFNDYFELILEILERIKIKTLVPNSLIEENLSMDDQQHNNINNQSYVKHQLFFNRTIVIIVCMLVKSSNKTDQNISNQFNDLLNDAAIDISYKFGDHLCEILSDLTFENEKFDILQSNSIFDAIKKIKSFSLDSIFKMDKFVNRLDYKWSSRRNKISS